MRAVLESVARGLPVANFNRRSLLTSVAVIVGVIALFFIPEILSFQSGSSPRRATKGEPSSSQAIIAASPLEKVLATMDVARDEETESSRARLGATPLSDDAEAILSQEDPEVIKKRSDAIWKVALSKGGKRAIVDARGASNKLIKAIRERYPESSFALLNFVSGLNYFTSSAARKAMTGMEAVNYLEQLQYTVTQTMLGERVDRSTYMSWMAISLYPIFEHSRTTRVAQSYQMPFQPNTTLVDVEVRIRKNGTSSLRVRGMVTGNDVKEILIYRNGVWLRTARVRVSRDDPSQSGSFSFNHRDASGKFTIRALDKFGKVNDKYYVFLGGRNGSVQPNLVGPDPRFDAYYRVGGRSS